MTSSLLAHCGGGQDKPGCLGPSAKLPRHFYFRSAACRRTSPLLIQGVLSRLPACSSISLARKQRPKLSCGEPRQRLEASTEFAGAQTPLAAEPAEKILGPPLPLLRVTFRARGDQIAVAIAPSPDTRNHMVEAPHHRRQPTQAVKADPAFACVDRLAQRPGLQEIRVVHARQTPHAR